MRRSERTGMEGDFREARRNNLGNKDGRERGQGKGRLMKEVIVVEKVRDWGMIDEGDEKRADT